MSSFSSVVNLRSAVSGRWRHFTYRFLDNSSIFDFHLGSEYFRRISNRKVFRSLGIYFSNFVFSKFSNFYSFFFDFSYSRFFGRFFEIKPGVLSFVQKKNFSSEQNSREIKFVKFSKISFLGSFLHSRGRFGLWIKESANFFYFFEPNDYYLRTSFARIISIKNRFFTKYVFFPFSEFINRIFIFRNPKKNIRNIRDFEGNYKTKNSSGFIRLLYYPFVRNKILNNSWLFVDKLRIVFYELLKFFGVYYFRFDPVKFKTIISNYENFFPFEFSSSKILNGWLFQAYYVYSVRKPFNFVLKKHAWALISLGYLDFNRVSSVRNLSNFSAIPASVISNVFKHRLKNRERVNPILRSLVRLMSSKENILGSVIAQHGRFSKRQRASHNVYRAGGVAFNSYLLPIDFSGSVSILKYSMVSIKVWVAYIPPIDFFVKLRSLSSNLVFPSVLDEKFSIYYSDAVGIQNYFGYYKASKLIHYRSGFKLGRFWGCSSNFCFFASVDYRYLKAYRRFSKFFMYSKRKYIKRILKLVNCLVMKN